MADVVMQTPMTPEASAQSAIETTTAAETTAHGESETQAPVRARRAGPLGWAAVIAGGPLILAALRLSPALDQLVFASPTVHFLVSGTAALLGVCLALLVVAAGVRIDDARTFLVGLALLSISELFTIHALFTPDVLVAGHGAITGRTALLSLLAGGMLLAVSGFELGAAANRRITAHAGLIALAVLLFWLLVGAAAFEPGQVAPAHHGGALELSTSRDLLTLLGVLCYLFAAWRHWRLYRRQPSPTGLALSAGIVLLGLALVTQWQTSRSYSIGFWLYHAQEFAAFGVISAAVLNGYRSGQSGAGLLEWLFLGGTRARLQASFTSALEALIDQIARGERPSAAQRRELQARFSLSEAQIRGLEQAAGAVAQERRQRQELERLNQRLLQLQRDKEQLAQMMVHDLKNPLTAMIGFLEMLQFSPRRLDDDQRTLVESALRSGKNLAGLIGDLLDAARLEEGKLELDYSLFDLTDLLRECAGQMGAWLIQEEKTIRIDAPGELSAVADRRLLRRVLLNLISNAIKHTPPRTSVILRARRAPDALVIEVEDDGPGIAPEHVGQIFERFGHVSASEGRQRNSGLGLSFCRLAIEAHGGAICVESTHGRGTTFRATLPLGSGPAAGESSPPATPTGRPAASDPV